MWHLGWLLAVAVSIALLAIWLRLPRRKSANTPCLTEAKREFHRHREHLEARFVQLASAAVKPGGHCRLDCTFADNVAYVRNRGTGELSAFVAVTVTDASSADDSLDDANDFADNDQAGTAVFRFDRDHWETDGRAILNLTPDEAVRYYQADLEIIAEELAHNS